MYHDAKWNQQHEQVYTHLFHDLKNVQHSTLFHHPPPQLQDLHRRDVDDPTLLD